MTLDFSLKLTPHTTHLVLEGPFSDVSGSTIPFFEQASPSLLFWPSLVERFSSSSSVSRVVSIPSKRTWPNASAFIFYDHREQDDLTYTVK